MNKFIMKGKFARVPDFRCTAQKVRPKEKSDDFTSCEDSVDKEKHAVVKHKNTFKRAVTFILCMSVFTLCFLYSFMNSAKAEETYTVTVKYEPQQDDNGKVFPFISIIDKTTGQTLRRWVTAETLEVEVESGHEIEVRFQMAPGNQFYGIVRSDGWNGGMFTQGTASFDEAKGSQKFGFAGRGDSITDVDALNGWMTTQNSPAGYYYYYLGVNNDNTIYLLSYDNIQWYGMTGDERLMNGGYVSKTTSTDDKVVITADYNLGPMILDWSPKYIHEGIAHDEFKVGDLFGISRTWGTRKDCIALYGGISDKKVVTYASDTTTAKSSVYEYPEGTMDAEWSLTDEGITRVDLVNTSPRGAVTTGQVICKVYDNTVTITDYFTAGSYPEGAVYDDETGCYKLVTTDYGGEYHSTYTADTAGVYDGYVIASNDDNKISVVICEGENYYKSDKNQIVRYWRPEEADYTVNCYFADENGSYRTLPDKSVSKRGIIGNTAAVTPSDYLSSSEKGKYEIDASKSTPGYQTKITADGQAEINLYFDRTKYSVTLTKGDNIASVTGAAKEVRWGAEVTINAVTESIVGYNTSFVNWTEGSSAVSKDNPYTFKMPQRDVSYRANGIKTPRTDIVYRVNHYTQNLDGTWKKYGSTEIYNNGTADSSVKTADYKKDIQGFTYSKSMADGKEVTEAIIKPDGSLVIDLYYTRNSYTLTVNPNGSTWTDGGAAYTQPRTYTLKYQETKTIADPVRTGYSFKKWVMTPSDKGSSISGKVFTMGYADTTLTVTMDKGSDSESWDVNTYTVTYDRNTPAGTISSEGGQTPDSLHTYDVTGSLSANGFTLSGYTFNGWKLDNKGNTYGNSANKGAVEVLNLTSEDGAVLTMYAQWKANTDTSYKVNHWIQKLYSDGTQAGGYLDGTVKSDAGKKNTDNYYLALTEQFTGTTDSFVTPDTATVGNKKLESEDFTIAGFTAPSKVTVQISGDGTTVVDYYYTRNWYDVGGNEVPGDDNPDDNPDDTPDDTPSVPGNPDRTEPEAGNGVDHITGGGTYQYQEKVTVSAVLKPGYHWDPDDEEFPSGWSGTENLPDADAYTKQTMTFTMPASNVVLKADATNNRYTVQWNKNTPSNATHTVEGEMSDVVYVYDKHKNASDNMYSLTGWDYVEWNTKPDGSGDVISNSADVFNLTTEDGAVVQLYAQWRAHTYTLKLSVNKPTDPILASNEISGEIADIELTYDTYTTLPDALTSISLEGWSFAGWYESAEYDESHKDNTDAHNDRITVSFGSHSDVLNTITGSLIRNQGRVMNFTTEQDAVITIYAQWTNNDYKIVFDDNGGYWGPGEMALNYDVASTLPSAPTRYGFKFLGWQDAVKNTYNPGEQVLNLTPEHGSQVIFTAQWEQRHFKLIKIASSMYNGTLIKRTEGDDAWYDSVGKLTINELTDYPEEKCIQRWVISETGTIERVK